MVVGGLLCALPLDELLAQDDLGPLHLDELLVVVVDDGLLQLLLLLLRHGHGVGGRGVGLVVQRAELVGPHVADGSARPALQLRREERGERREERGERRGLGIVLQLRAQKKSTEARREEESGGERLRHALQLRREEQRERRAERLRHAIQLRREEKRSSGTTALQLRRGEGQGKGET